MYSIIQLLQQLFEEIYWYYYDYFEFKTGSLRIAHDTCVVYCLQMYTCTCINT